MALKIITPPETEPLSLTEAKKYLKPDESTDDLEITSLIKQAREWCEDYQSKKYITQTLELVLDFWPNEIEFRDCSPVQSIVSIKYTDSTGVENTLAATDYILDNDSFVNRIVPAYGKLWPCSVLQPINGIRIRFIAGYGDGAAVPESVKWAMVLHMQTLYESLSAEDKQRIEKARDNLLGMRRVIPV